MTDNSIQNLDIGDAIFRRHLLGFEIAGTRYVVEPHIYGINGEGKQALAAWQLEPGLATPAVQGAPTVFDCEVMRKVQLLDETFETARPGYQRGSWQQYGLKKVYHSIRTDR